MVVWLLGLVLFALGIGLSVALHEAGHMLTAKAFGMKVRRYFIGFGPKVFSFRRGETEYGLKIIPGGGFCDIAGMTALDPVTPEEAPRAMWRYSTWKRVVVMSAGSLTHFVLGFIILYLMAVTMGLPNTDLRPIVGATACAVPTQDRVELTLPECGPNDPSPAAAAGIQEGDEIVAVNGETVSTWKDMVAKVRGLSGPNRFDVVRDGERRTVTMDVATVQRAQVEATKGSQDNRLERVGAVGISLSDSVPYSGGAALGGTLVFTGDMFAKTWEGLMNFPKKIPAVVRAIGGEDDPERPVSVVGASVIGADAAEQGIWSIFVLMLAALNFFVGVFNLLPLLPLDGGHIAVVLYERVRDALRKLRGKAPGGPVDYNKLAGVTMVFVILGGAVVLLTVTADVINPIRLPQ
ncbi:Membrane-associated zinc metalloprotease [Actinokineospora spheciospongiae]|uniref:Membrane-associated zinc metalloprotease n=1 Tax=Actinokineospora spheciospongiae TaxID=909613 RepID=W7IP26_9PSEU|nr:site-2 protease family protein [Actinokineospora spheciospongiae]EWC62635.1 Membrane-associated zinc metalloprotease [Actinokineospora spheciospongiae]PWW54216.1 RIP metalloprotease RseP [Actinokineospora spheciospongiae]